MEFSCAKGKNEILEYFRSMNEMDNTEQMIKKFSPMVESLTMPELILLNRLVVDRLNLIRKAGTLYSMSKFRRGDRVKWVGSDGNHREGIVIKLNQKTASIITRENQHWNVSPELLNKA